MGNDGGGDEEREMVDSRVCEGLEVNMFLALLRVNWESTVDLVKG